MLIHYNWPETSFLVLVISLDALCKRFRIDNSKRVKHNAIIDCELLSKIYINLIDQKEPTFELNVERDLNSELTNSENVHILIK